MDVMGIAKLATSIADTGTAQDVGIAMLKKAQDLQADDRHPAAGRGTCRNRRRTCRPTSASTSTPPPERAPADRPKKSTGASTGSPPGALFQPRTRRTGAGSQQTAPAPPLRRSIVRIPKEMNKRQALLAAALAGVCAANASARQRPDGHAGQGRPGKMLRRGQGRPERLRHRHPRLRRPGGQSTRTRPNGARLPRAAARRPAAS
jgi:hypothetical protein